MSCLQPAKLHVYFSARMANESHVTPRFYTLTHSDRSGDLFLTIDTVCNKKQISGWYTRFMRDEVLAEWRIEKSFPVLHVYCHVSGGLTFGRASWRYAIFKRELPLVLEAFRYGDQDLYSTHKEFDTAPIKIHFQSHLKRFHRIELWGTPGDYRI
jgi:hypothetical protein